MASPGVASDDLPWPELGNVSRGATRGNQGQKGVLGPPEADGCCVLQLRVQPGVLAVKLNRQASEWYRILDNEVNRALKLTKTYWRKARRRQDYDSRGDQDHMELHEWLQQLKDKTMAHLELLMQKGEIQGPPYVMPEETELTFLRKFIERQAAGIPHNPRLRNAGTNYQYPEPSGSSPSPDASDSYLDHTRGVLDVTDGSGHHLLPATASPSLRTHEALAQEANSSRQALRVARATLSRAQQETQEAFLRYTASLDAERQARQAVTVAEKRRDELMGVLISMNQLPIDQPSRHSSASLDDHQSAVRYHVENSNDMKMRSNVKPMEWPDANSRAVYPTDPVGHLENFAAPSQDPSMRKHTRTWEPGPHMTDAQYCDDMTSLPPRKRMHHMMPGYDVLDNSILQPPNMNLPS